MEATKDTTENFELLFLIVKVKQAGAELGQAQP